MQKEHFRVGIIGCGRMADTIEDEQIERRRTHPYRGGLVLPYSHAAGYTALQETEMVAACDVDAARLQVFVERWQIPAAYKRLSRHDCSGKSRYRQCRDAPGTARRAADICRRKWCSWGLRRETPVHVVGGDRCDRCRF